MVWTRRDPLCEKLVHADMLERRTMIKIPEFYVGKFQIFFEILSKSFIKVLLWL
jgi:hypothetical protein